MALRITDITKDLPRLNTELSRFDQHQQQIEELRAQVGNLQRLLLNTHNTDATSSFTETPKNLLNHNSVLFVWNGGTLTISWVAGFIFSNGHYLPIPAGSLHALASTYYWMAWNPKQQQMSAVTAVGQILAMPNVHNMLIVGQIFTGTAGQTGTAGGGGSEPGGGTGIAGKQYKLF
jgi:hypothetical protein